MIPLLAGPIAIIYNLPIPELVQNSKQLQLSRQVIVDIFTNKITTWNDTRIQQYNPDISLPSNPIIRVVSSIGSGTTDIFTTALSSFDPTGFGRTIGRTNTVRDWGNETSSNMIRVKGASAVSSTVLATPFSISYNILAESINNAFSTVQNKAGNFIYPNITTVQVLYYICFKP